MLVHTAMVKRQLGADPCMPFGIRVHSLKCQGFVGVGMGNTHNADPSCNFKPAIQTNYRLKTGIPEPDIHGSIERVELGLLNKPHDPLQVVLIWLVALGYQLSKQDVGDVVINISGIASHQFGCGLEVGVGSHVGSHSDFLIKIAPTCEGSGLVGVGHVAGLVFCFRSALRRWIAACAILLVAL